MRRTLFLLFLGFSLSLCAQSYRSRIHHRVVMGSESQLHQLILLDYTKLLGTAQKVTSQSIFFTLRESGETTIVPITELRYIGVFTQASSGKDASFGYPEIPLSDLNYERTALPFSSKGQLRIVQLFYAVTEWAVNDNLQLGVGLLSPVVPIATQKLRFPILPNLHLGVSNQIGYPLPSQGQFDGRGTLFIGDAHAMVTLGTHRRFFNLGAGLMYNTDRFVENGSARTYRMGVGARLNRRWTLYGEALAVLEKGTTFSARRNLTLLPTVNGAYSKRRHRWNFGVALVVLDQNTVVPTPVPYLGYSRYWGGR